MRLAVSDVQQELLTLVQARLAAIEREIAEPEQLRHEVEHFQHRLADCHPDEHEAFRTCIDAYCFTVSECTDGKEYTDDCL